MRKIPITDVGNAKAVKVPLIIKGSGGGAKCAKEPAGGRGSRAKLVIAPDVASGRRLIEQVGWKNTNVAIVTEPEHLTGIAIYPNEDIYMVMGSNEGFIEQLQTAATMFVPGESFNLKLYAL